MNGAAWDLETESGVLAYANDLMISLRREFVEHGEVEVGFLCLATWTDGKPLPHVTPTAIVFDAIESMPRGQVATSVKRLARETRSAGVFSYAESWAVDFQDEAERMAWSCRNWGEHPRAVEFVHVMLEHRSVGTRVWRAFITRDAEGRGTLGDFDEMPRLLRAKGRFAEFLDFSLNEA